MLKAEKSVNNLAKQAGLLAAREALRKSQAETEKTLARVAQAHYLIERSKKP